ncbi:MAG TPA: hypothetical protein VD902_20120, partial [Symbiobacteriaceae bacterium]|nr:hypothetical protein [Symbiobacteriaceae bacterium]
MKRLLSVLVLSIWLIGIAIPALAAPSVDMAAQAVGGGRVRTGNWVTVLVDLTNQGGEVEGELVVEPVSRGPWESRPQYVVPLTLPAGGKKRVPVDLPVQLAVDLKASFQVQGRAVQEQVITLQALAPDAMFIGVLSDDEIGVPALSRLGANRPGSAQPQVARLDAATFPARAKILDPYNVIVLSRFDTSKLAKEQIQALSGWVGRGGMLVIAGGPEWKRTFSALPEALVPVAVTDVREVSAKPLADYTGKALDGQVPVSHGRLERGQAAVAAGDTPLVVVDQVGAGRVIYLAFDPGLNPMVTWPGQADLLERVLGTGLRQEMWKQENPESIMQSALQRIPGLGLPSSLLLGAILGGYIVLVGPISYLILHRKDRREWMWFTVPALSVAFVAVVYGVGSGKQTSVLSNVITVTELSAGTG